MQCMKLGHQEKKKKSCLLNADLLHLHNFSTGESSRFHIYIDDDTVLTTLAKIQGLVLLLCAFRFK